MGEGGRRVIRHRPPGDASAADVQYQRQLQEAYPCRLQAGGSRRSWWVSSGVRREVGGEGLSHSPRLAARRRLNAADAAS